MYFSGKDFEDLVPEIAYAISRGPFRNSVTVTLFFVVRFRGELCVACPVRDLFESLRFGEGSNGVNRVAPKGFL